MKGISSFWNAYLAIERVRDLHKPENCNCDPGVCEKNVCQSCSEDYPCPTIKAIGGDVDTAKPNELNISTSAGELG